MQRWHIKIVTSVLLSFLLAGPTFGQFTSGLQGVLEDASGGGIPNATVKLRNVSTALLPKLRPMSPADTTSGVSLPDATSSPQTHPAFSRRR